MHLLLLFWFYSGWWIGSWTQTPGKREREREAGRVNNNFKSRLPSLLIRSLDIPMGWQWSQATNVTRSDHRSFFSRLSFFPSSFFSSVLRKEAMPTTAAHLMADHFLVSGWPRLAYLWMLRPPGSFCPLDTLDAGMFHPLSFLLILIYLSSNSLPFRPNGHPSFPMASASSISLFLYWLLSWKIYLLYFLPSFFLYPGLLSFNPFCGEVEVIYYIYSGLPAPYINIRLLSWLSSFICPA